MDREDTNHYLAHEAWDALPVGLLWLDLHGLTIVRANPAAMHMLDLPKPLGRRAMLDLLTPGAQTVLASAAMEPVAWPGRTLDLVLNTGDRVRCARWLKRVTQGSRRLGLLSIDAEPAGATTEAEQAKLSATLETLHQFFGRLLSASSEQDLLKAACEGVTTSGRYQLAWIGLVDPADPGRIAVVARSGPAMAYIQDVEIRSDQGWGVMGVAARAIQAGHTVLNNNLAADLGRHPYAERALAHGLHAAVGIPVISQGQVIGVLCIYADQIDAFGATQLVLFEQLASNIVLAMREFEARQSYINEATQRAATARHLEAVLEQTIETLSGALAERDPYTVGHQRRVAEIAVNLAHRLGLSEERCHVLYLAGIVHDIGKIRVPIDLLTKPTRLRPQEFEVIKQHAQATIDILGSIDWPWPLQQIAGQHHERLDGSGYPAGLRGEQILPEARILAVADVIESMSSPRPYRPAAGMAAALEVLRQGRGISLDADVVDAALALYRDSKQPDASVLIW